MNPDNINLQIIRETQFAYFEILEKHFFQERGKLFLLTDPAKIMDIVNNSISSSNLTIISNRLKLNNLVYKIEQLLNDIVGFWSKSAPQYLESLSNMKDHYFVSINKNSSEISESMAPLALYFDSILINDPLLLQYNTIINTKGEDVNLQQFAASTLYSYLHLIYNKNLFISQNDISIAIICPKMVYLSSILSDRIQDRTFIKSKQIINELTGRNFSDMHEALNYFIKKPIEKIIKNKNLAEEIYDCSDRDINTYLNDLRKMHYSSTGDKGIQKDKNNLWALWDIVGNVRNLLIGFEESQVLGVDPFIEKYQMGLYKLILKYESEESEGVLGKNISDEHLFNFSLQKPNMNWLNQISMDEVIKLRQNNEMEELRNIFRVSSKLIRNANIYNIEETVEKFSYTLQNKMEAHNFELINLSKKYKLKMNKAVAELTGSAVLTIASTLLPPISIPASIISLIIGGKSVRDMAEIKSESQKENQNLGKRPIGYLYDIYKKSKDN